MPPPCRSQTSNAASADAIADGRDELVELASALISFDTTAREVGDPPRQEAALQDYLAEGLLAYGAEIDLFEPDAAAMAGAPLVPEGLDFAGRPQLIATLRGSGGGQSLLFNGHIDVVSGEPKAEWTTDPFTPEIRDGKLYGRGACDMKGGVAAMAYAAQAIAAANITLAGDLIVATNTDEESSGAGGSALVARGLRADAGIVTEPTDFRTWVACRGSEYGVMRVPGRPGHAEVRHPDWRHGGAVNAIEKSGVVLEAIASLRERWAADSAFVHPVLSVALPAADGGERRRVAGDLSLLLRPHARGHVPPGPGRRRRLGLGGARRGRRSGSPASARAMTGWPSTRRCLTGGATA